MDKGHTFHLGAAKAHYILAKAYHDQKDESMRRYHVTRAKEEIVKAKEVYEKNNKGEKND